MSIHEAIITIAQFETKEDKAYWIDKLSISLGYKGYLLHLFKLV